MTRPTGSGLELLHRAAQGEARKTPLLFVHGAFGAAWCWDEHFLPWFAKRGYDAYAVSLRGHGASPERDRLQDYGILDFVEDLAETVAALPHPPVLIGHSMGGFVVQKYLETGAAAGCVLMAPVPPSGLLGPGLSLAVWNPTAVWEIGAIEVVGERYATPQTMRVALFSETMPATLAKAYFSRMGNESRRATLDMFGLGVIDPARVPRMPMLVLGAAQDILIPPAFVRATARSYGTEAEIFPDMAHGMMLERGWEAVARRIHDWLAAEGF